MCVSFFIFDSLEEFPLVLAFNRDEVIERSTHVAHFWPDKPHILGGRDQVAGGSWLCFSVSSGRLAWLTNFWERTQPPVGPPSRGELPVNFVEGSASPLEYLSSVDGSVYPGFNLMVADLATGQLGYLCNRAGSQPQAVPPGLHGVTNGTLDAPWVKVETGKAALQRLVEGGAFEGGEVPWDEIFHIMSDDRVLETDPSKLPQVVPGPGFQYAASSIFVKPIKTFLGTCGTRSQTVLAVRQDGMVEWRERYMRDDGRWGEVRHVVRLKLWDSQGAGWRGGQGGGEPEGRPGAGASEGGGEGQRQGPCEASGPHLPQQQQGGLEVEAEEAVEGPGKCGEVQANVHCLPEPHHHQQELRRLVQQRPQDCEEVLGEAKCEGQRHGRQCCQPCQRRQQQVRAAEVGAG